ncbi:MAG: hypothetical protein J7574_07360 [Flavobacterium sp.]|uniref:hypothetical protein n=1 Tax=Flavobacterium sp. TaxID=239 RepID=UPI001B06DEAB|nr:hypothetical protein [Flavobacterium sp.]MBO9583959.1 hypothetical protein [Flavobacterium sp.]
MILYTIVQLLLVSFAATSAMTWFSYAMSETFRELYKEPVLLTYVVKKLDITLSKRSQKIWAWLIHYIIGLLFVIGYHIVWVKDIVSISPLTALLFGAISGLIGILGWVFLFKITHHQPPIDFRGYYIQLFFAHIIFAIVATAFYYITLILISKAYVTF